jgi:hypothetical protein
MHLKPRLINKTKYALNTELDTLSYTYFFILLNTLKDIKISYWKIIVFYAISTRYATYHDQIALDPPEDFVVSMLWLVAGSCRTFSEMNTKKSRANYSNETRHPRKITEEGLNYWDKAEIRFALAVFGMRFAVYS